MKQFTITIQDKEGLHARPAGLLSKAAKGFQCAVTLTKGEKTADLKKIFASNYFDTIKPEKPGEG